jgi:hypothetical protein
MAIDDVPDRLLRRGADGHRFADQTAADEVAVRRGKSLYNHTEPMPYCHSGTCGLCKRELRNVPATSSVTALTSSS